MTLKIQLKTPHDGPPILRLCLKRFPIELGSHSCNGEGLDFNVHAGNHVVREVTINSTSDFRARTIARVDGPISKTSIVRVFAVITNKVCNEHLVFTTFLAIGNHNTARQLHVFHQRSLNSPQNDRISSNLNHKVTTTKDLNLAIRQESRTITRAVHQGLSFLPFLFRRKWIVNKPLRRQLGKVQVASCQHFTTHEQLARLTEWQWLALFVHNVTRRGGISHGTEFVGRAQVQVAGGQIQCGNLVTFRNGIKIEKTDMAEGVNDLFSKG
mmetsp:Transcript_25380/g.54574  ORF Transcript_25380/g.54574 Transcript_25380/m.54574 type:complete len:269 (+) Transcript_25380:906-1712(+)